MTSTAGGDPADGCGELGSLLRFCDLDGLADLYVQCFGLRLSGGAPIKLFMVEDIVESKYS